MKNGEGESFVGIRAVAALLGVSVSTVRRLARRTEHLPTYRFGGQLRFRLSEVVAWAEANLVKRESR